MNYEEVLKSIQQEVKSKISFKKEIRTVELLEEYTEAYEQYVMGHVNSLSQANGGGIAGMSKDQDTRSMLGSDADVDCKHSDDGIEDRQFHQKILDFIEEITAKDVKVHSISDHVTRQIAGAAYAIMGKCYLRGIFGSARDVEVAVDSFNKSITCRNPTGMFELARCFELGIGVDKDPERACLLYRASYKLGYTKGLHRYALLLIKGSQYVPRNILDGYYILRQATLAKERIYISPYYDLAMLYKSGVCDIFNDHYYALKIFTIGANKGCRYCQFKLGEEWQMGEVVERDLEKAFFWYRTSAQNNLSDAQLKVARILYGIEAIPNSEKDKSIKLGALAERQIDLQSVYRFGKRYRMTELESAVIKQKLLLDFQQIYGDGFDRLREGYSMALKSAINGNLEAILLVAEALEKGFGVGRNILESLWWYRIAEALGSDNVREKMHLLETKLGKKVI